MALRDRSDIVAGELRGTPDDDTITITQGGAGGPVLNSGGPISGLTGDDTYNLHLNDGQLQFHTFETGGNDTFNLHFAVDTAASLANGVHLRSGRGNDTINFLSVGNVTGVAVGRLEDFSFTDDTLAIDGLILDLNDLDSFNSNLPSGVLQVRTVAHNGEHDDPDTDAQQWLLIETIGGGTIFYALEGARIDENGSGGANGGNQESHFLTVLPDFQSLTDIVYQDPVNVTPESFSPDGGIIIDDADSDANDAFAHVSGSQGGDLIALGLNNDRANAGDGNDHVWGGDGNDLIRGGNGNDTVEGGTGNDTLIGNNGNDFLIGGRGVDSLTAGSGNDFVSGGIGEDEIFGGDGDDTLDGGAGGDTIDGGLGFDFVSFESSIDRVQAKLEGGALVVGDAVGDVFSGVEGFIGSSRNDVLVGDSQSNILRGGNASDRLQGRAGDDTLEGGTGADKLYGNNGEDEMSGGGGRDRFIYFNTSDSGVGSGNRDIIVDFEADIGERIEISRFDADLTQSQNQAFNFVGTAAFSNTAGELRFDQSSGSNTIIQADQDGDGLADFEIELLGTVDLLASNFLL